MKNVMMGLFSICLMVMGATAHAEGVKCVRYYKDSGKVAPDVVTFTLEQVSENQYTGKIYYQGNLDKEVTDMVVKGRMDDGRLVIGSRSLMFIELRLDQQTGKGIFYNGLGYDVKCSAI